MKSDDKKELIIKSARECFARYGYDKTTLEDIGKIAKLNKASLYYYYKNKEDIFIQVILQESTQYMSDLQKKTESYEGYEDKIINYLTDRLKYYKQVLNLHQLSIESLHKLEPVFEHLYQTVLEKEVAFIADLLQKGIGEKVFIPHSVQDVGEALMLIADALKHDAASKSKALFTMEIDYSVVEVKIKFIIGLVLEGLKKN